MKSLQETVREAISGLPHDGEVTANTPANLHVGKTSYSKLLTPNEVCKRGIWVPTACYYCTYLRIYSFAREASHARGPHSQDGHKSHDKIINPTPEQKKRKRSGNRLFAQTPPWCKQASKQNILICTILQRNLALCYVPSSRCFNTRRYRQTDTGRARWDQDQAAVGPLPGWCRAPGGGWKEDLSLIERGRTSLGPCMEVFPRTKDYIHITTIMKSACSNFGARRGQ